MSGTTEIMLIWGGQIKQYFTNLNDNFDYGLEEN